MWSSFLGWVHSTTDLDQGTTLLVNTTLKFVDTARLDGKLSVKAMKALQGPCFAFESDAFVAASAELHFENCHNDNGKEVDGGAMNVRGNLMVMGTLIIRDCRTKDGKGGSLGSNPELMMEGLKRLICGFAMLSFGMPLVLENRWLGGQARRRIFVASASQPQVRLLWGSTFSTTEASPSSILRQGDMEVPCS